MMRAARLQPAPRRPADCRPRLRSCAYAVRVERVHARRLRRPPPGGGAGAACRVGRMGGAVRLGSPGLRAGHAVRRPVGDPRRRGHGDIPAAPRHRGHAAAPPAAAGRGERRRLSRPAQRRPGGARCRARRRTRRVHRVRRAGRRRRTRRHARRGAGGGHRAVVRRAGRPPRPALHRGRRHPRPAAGAAPAGTGVDRRRQRPGAASGRAVGRLDRRRRRSGRPHAGVPRAAPRADRAPRTAVRLLRHRADRELGRRRPAAERLRRGRGHLVAGVDPRHARRRRRAGRPGPRRTAGRSAG